MTALRLIFTALYRGIGVCDALYGRTGRTGVFGITVRPCWNQPHIPHTGDPAPFNTSWAQLSPLMGHSPKSVQH